MRDDSPEAAAFRAAVFAAATDYDVEGELARLHVWIDERSYRDPVASDLGMAAVINGAIRLGWRPDPDVQPGVTIADTLAQGDRFGRYWLPSEPRELGSPADRIPLAIAADAATTYLNSLPRPKEQ